MPQEATAVYQILQARKANSLCNCPDNLPCDLDGFLQGCFAPQLKVFSNPQELSRFVSSRRFEVWSGVTLLGRLHSFHVAHAIMDGLYPALCALRKFGLDELPFRTLRFSKDCKSAKVCYRSHEALVNEAFKAFGGLGLVEVEDLLKEPRSIQIQIAVTDTQRGTSNMWRTANVALGGGREFRMSRLFRKRMHWALDLPVRRGDDQRMSIIEVLNHPDYFGGDNFIAKIRQIKEVEQMQVDYVHWQDMASLRSQLLQIHRTAVHVSGPGSGGVYQIFLHDHSVHVNLGRLRNGVPLVLEQYIAEAAPYIRALYYNTSNRACGLDLKQFSDLLKRAVHLYYQGFRIPVPPGANLSPEGKVFQRMCSSTSDRCKDLVENLNWYKKGISKACSSVHFNWVELIVFELGPHSGQDCGLTNDMRTLMRSLRYDAGSVLHPPQCLLGKGTGRCYMKPGCSATGLPIPGEWSKY
eukprot:gnl/MRDRNA2_/MRDRNA2_26338_c0_seq1.p1 gnl/MRDRNA2_/MRDRNA2_26338_c0~~gnl/MRDRNA2_/MRDRNA2_26338_c0_seq1.p1  ORF type:complete len:467 (+),score=52.17 gnl/MRDRNA2_/MRDRNA2_26338_c0_seq1:109-1509(+)